MAYQKGVGASSQKLNDGEDVAAYAGCHKRSATVAVLVIDVARTLAQ